MVRNHRFFNRKFNRPGTQARTRPGAPPMAQMWPEQRWRRKWSEIIDSLIRSLRNQGNRPELGQKPRTCQDVARATLEAAIVRNHRFWNRRFNKPGTQAKTRPGAPPMAQMWSKQRWRRKRSKIIDSIIRSLIEPGHVRAQGQDRPAQEAEVAQTALAAEMVRNHRFFNKKFNIAKHGRDHSRDRPAQEADKQQLQQ